ncbi:hypothetical protein C7447_103259 [Tenacibaculum adriaticum]|uniref:Uncharacterized protein n=1 Tax=Tenacibaculum adriaticum TaxID=413713 RepID=A0A5S5DTX3_9FLAO|nr:hypothetical protein [Tenacibaculum adriaticum]TYP98089.1 hypothetical protein C7447_103259 [Tenacibaculum adriaticum]
MKKVKLSLIHHHNKDQIAIRFSYNKELIALVKSIKGAKWSISNKCWYVENSNENLQNIYTILGEVCNIDTTGLYDIKKSKPTKRTRILSDEQKTLR